MSGDTVPVLYNNCYGGFGFSKKAVEEYNKRLPAGSTQVNVGVKIGPFAKMLAAEKRLDAGSSAIEEKYAWEIERADPLMVQICKELGDEANTEFSEIAIEEVPRKFKNHYVISSYDGLEQVQVDMQQYKLDRIKGILNDKVVSNKGKVKMAQDVLLEQNPFEEDAN
jgi:hypothetical protein